MPDWIVPWMIAAAAIWPLVLLERWMHRHIQGLGLLLTNDAQAAVLVYYLLLLPGVALHEISQWLLAKALRVKVKRFSLWPEKQRGGVIRLGLVEIEKDIDPVRATLVGMIPVVAGVAVIALIGTTHFRTDLLLDSLSSGDLPTILQGIGAFTSTTDFWLWVYLVFAIANAMLPEEHDRINWWMLGGAAAGVLAFLWILDLSILIQAGLEGPLAQMARWMSLALVIAIGVDLLVMALVATLELIFSRVLGRDLEYG